MRRGGCLQSTLYKLKTRKISNCLSAYIGRELILSLHELGQREEMTLTNIRQWRIFSHAFYRNPHFH